MGYYFGWHRDYYRFLKCGYHLLVLRSHVVTPILVFYLLVLTVSGRHLLCFLVIVPVCLLCLNYEWFSTLFYEYDTHTGYLVSLQSVDFSSISLSTVMLPSL